MVTPDPSPTDGLLVREKAVGNGVLSVSGAAAEGMPEDKHIDFVWLLYRMVVASSRGSSLGSYVFGLLY